jgi:hypothetical protein
MRVLRVKVLLERAVSIVWVSRGEIVLSVGRVVLERVGVGVRVEV